MYSLSICCKLNSFVFVLLVHVYGYDVHEIEETKGSSSSSNNYLKFYHS